MDVEDISQIVGDSAFRLHRDLGPGLLESVYEAVLARMLERRGLRVERQEAIAFDFDRPRSGQLPLLGSRKGSSESSTNTENSRLRAFA